MFGPWHRVQPYTLSVCELNGWHLMAVEKLTTTMTLPLTLRHGEPPGELLSAECPSHVGTP